MSESFKFGEAVRENYRRQGEARKVAEVLAILADPEWHEDSKVIGRAEDLAHVPDYCSGCQLAELIRAGSAHLTPKPASFKNIEFDTGVLMERKRIIELLLSLNIIRRDMLGTLVAFDTHGERVVDLKGLEK